MNNWDERYAEKNLESKNIKEITIEDKCQICDSSENLHKHHKDYGKREEIVLVCAKCHRRIHEYKRDREQKKGYTLYLDDEIIKSLEDEKYETRKSPSFIVNELLKKRFKDKLKKEDKK